MSCKTARQIIMDSAAWKSGTAFTPCDASRRINAANAASKISTRRAIEIMGELVQTGDAVKIAKNKWRSSKVSPPTLLMPWRIRSDEELGITSYLTGGMGWVHKHELGAA